MARDTQIRKDSVRSKMEKKILTAAKKVFSEYGFKGATTKRIADEARVPHGTFHYYFSTKDDIYEFVIQDIYAQWLNIADYTHDDNQEPKDWLTGYITEKMEFSRYHPLDSKIWALELIQGARRVEKLLNITLAQQTKRNENRFKKWISAGKIRPINHLTALSMIWAVTEQYADFDVQFNALNHGKPLSEQEWKQATEDIINFFIHGLCTEESM